MTDPAQIGAQQRAALLAAWNSPDRTFRRGAGGWTIAPAAGEPLVFTVRLIRAMDRDYLVRLDGDFADTAPLTNKGLEIAKRLSDPQPYSRDEDAYVSHSIRGAA